MEKFLKQYSIIPEEFINDFFTIAKENYIDNEIIINFNNVCKWLNVLKENLKKNLIKHFEEKFDFTITKKTIKHKNSQGASIT